MFELISDNHQLLHKIGLVLLVFSSFLVFVSNAIFNKPDREITALRFGLWLLMLAITIGGLAAYYSLRFVRYNNLILLFLFLTIFVVSIFEIRRIFSEEISIGGKIFLTLAAILIPISDALLLFAILGST